VGLAEILLPLLVPKRDFLRSQGRGNKPVNLVVPAPVAGRTSASSGLRGVASGDGMDGQHEDVSGIWQIVITNKHIYV
jgi:hypothetical protein